MERRNQHGVAERMHPSTQLADRVLCPQQGLGRDGPEREDDLRLDDAEFRVEKRPARGELVSFRVSVTGRSAQDSVRDKHFVPRELHRLQHLGEKLPRAPDERQALRVLVGARTLADHDELRARIARAEHDRGAALAELALAASLQRALLCRERLRGTEQIVAVEGNLTHAHVAMVPESVSERGEGARE